MSEVVFITRAEAVEAIRRCGFTIGPDDVGAGREIVHSIAGSGGFALGRDMDVADAIAAVENCTEDEDGIPQVAWADSMFGRCLCLIRPKLGVLRLDTVTPE